MSLLITIFLCGDVMTGRGIDQVFPQSCRPHLFEPYLRDAREYVRLAEEANGPIPRPVEHDYVWGDALKELNRTAPDVRIINLETSVTVSEQHWEGKSIHYRMHPANVFCLTTAGVDCCSLANNHVLDWGRAGLEETLDSLRQAGVKTAGAGHTAREAQAAAVIPVEGKGRVLVFGLGSPTAGVFPSWKAAEDTPGVHVLSDLSGDSVRAVADAVRAVKRERDVVVASIHWGSNWGYDIPRDQIAFAHRLIDDAGVDIVHGHSSHHVKGLEIYRDKLVLYGCGDFLNDYEGIGGHDAYRPDLSLMYFVSVDTATGTLAGLRMVPMQVRQFRLHHASRADGHWLEERLTRECRGFSVRIRMNEDGSLSAHWKPESTD